MKDAEARRRRLLYETRNLYRDDKNIPPVHPRYRTAHASLYPDDMEQPKSSLKLRTVISILCFVGYLALDYGEITVSNIDSALIREQIIYQIQADDITEFLKTYQITQ